MDTISMDKAGRIVIPKKIRDEGHIQPGNLNIRLDADGRVILEPVRPKGRIIYKNGLAVFTNDTGQAVSLEQVNRIIQEDRESRGMIEE